MDYETDVVRGLKEDAFEYGAEADDLLDTAEAFEAASLAIMRETGNAARAAEFERQASETRNLASIKADLRDHAWWMADSMVVNAAAAELVRRTPGAEFIDDVGRIRRRRWTDLLAEESGVPWYRVGHIAYEQTRAAREQARP
ncbi:MAG TPA: hypothetical protein VFI15_04800 [Candidatus Limnocylindrales bacterium]|nr:hypothetical protein [Candidatus Limnocylindrales bacterium]